MADGDTFALMLARFRERKGLSKTGLAKALEVSPGYVYLLEKGQSAPPTLERVQQIVDTLSLSAAESEELRLAAAMGRTGEAEADILKRSGPRQVDFKQKKTPKTKKGAAPQPGVNLNHCVALTVDSDDAEPSLRPGQLALCNPDREPTPGELAAATLANGRTRFGLYYPQETGVLMASTKPAGGQAPTVLCTDSILKVMPVVGVVFQDP